MVRVGEEGQGVAVGVKGGELEVRVGGKVVKMKKNEEN